MLIFPKEFNDFSKFGNYISITTTSQNRLKNCIQDSMAQNNGFMPIKSPQKQPKRSLRRSKTRPRFAYDVPRQPKTPPRRPQDAPKALPREAKRPPRSLQDASKTPPRRSKMPPKTLWIAQDGPRGLQTCPGALQTSILDDF